MVVGPRTSRGTAGKRACGGDSRALRRRADGWRRMSPPTDRVSDADGSHHRCSAGRAERPRHRGVGDARRGPADPGHLGGDALRRGRGIRCEPRVVRLSSEDSIPNRDFVLRWSVAGAETQFGVLAHRGTGGFLTLMMQPPLDLPTSRSRRARSPSSSTSPAARWVAARDLEGDRAQDAGRAPPEDAFNIFFFATATGSSGRSRSRGRRERRRGEAVPEPPVRRRRDGDARRHPRVLHARHDPRFLQMYVFLTDGYVATRRRS